MWRYCGLSICHFHIGGQQNNTWTNKTWIINPKKNFEMTEDNIAGKYFFKENRKNICELCSTIQLIPGEYFLKYYLFDEILPS